MCASSSRCIFRGTKNVLCSNIPTTQNGASKAAKSYTIFESHSSINTQSEPDQSPESEHRVFVLPAQITLQVFGDVSVFLVHFAEIFPVVVSEDAGNVAEQRIIGA